MFQALHYLLSPTQLLGLHFNPHYTLTWLRWFNFQHFCLFFSEFKFFWQSSLNLHKNDPGKVETRGFQAFLLAKVFSKEKEDEPKRGKFCTKQGAFQEAVVFFDKLSSISNRHLKTRHKWPLKLPTSIKHSRNSIWGMFCLIQRAHLCLLYH